MTSDPHMRDHAQRHAIGGPDEITPEMIAATPRSEFESLVADTVALSGDVEDVTAEVSGIVNRSYQQGEITIPDGSLTGAQAIQPVDTAKYDLRALGATGDATLELFDSQTVVARRDEAAGPVTVAFQITGL